MNAFVAAIDCGTTLVKSAILRVDGEIRGIATQGCPCLQTADGGVENSPAAMLRACLGSVREALLRSGVRPHAVEAIAVTNQRATLLCLDGRGAPIGNALSWQDMRGGAEIEKLRRRIPDDRYYAIAGLPNHPVFTLAKILWIRANDPARFRRTEHFSLVQDFVLRHLGAEEFVCDWANASLTGLLDVAALDWSDRLVDLCGIARARLPRLVPPGRRVGSLSRRAAHETGLPEGLPLISGAGDQQCAGIGAGAVAPGVVEVTLGTAAVALSCALRPAGDPERRVTCCAHAVPGKWEIEGLQTSAGSCIEWLSKVTNGGRRFTPAFFNGVAKVEPGARGAVFLPYLAGASAPHWMPGARGAFIGLRLGHGREELARAVMEGVSMQTREIVDVFGALGVRTREIRLTGGGTAIGAWNQMQADIFNIPVSTLRVRHATLLGAAMLAAVGAGAYASLKDAAARMVRLRRTYRPIPERAAAYARLYGRFRGLHEGTESAGVFGRCRRSS